MTSRSLLLGSAAVALTASALAAPAQAAHFHGWYVGIEAGANWVKDWDFTSQSTLFTPHTHFDTAQIDTGWAVLATVGYAFDHWRLELEAGYRENDADFRTSRSGAINTISGGDVRELSLMANALYDLHLTDRLMFSLGAGAGMDKVKIDFTAPFAAGNVDDWEFAYQGIAGLSYAIGSRTDLTLTYRYLHVDAPDLDFGPFNGHPFTDTEDLEKHTVTIGLRFDLSPDTQPEAPRAPVAAAPPPPEPTATSFVIFFAFNKCNITAEADRVLGQAASAAQSSGEARVVIVGHTDTSGSSRYNQKLSVCRANAAAKNLEHKGVARSAISTSGRGETELLVRTADGVKEPQNRRATVDIDD